MGPRKRKALHDGSQGLREVDGGVRSRTFAEELPVDGEPLDPRIDQLVRLIARQAARDTMDAYRKRSRHDRKVKRTGRNKGPSQ
jgi:hypothetical protein